MAIVLFMDGEEQINRRRIMDGLNPFELEDSKFVRNFRLNKNAFRYVMEQLIPQVNGGTSMSIPPIIMLATTLRFMAEGGYQFGVGKDASIGLSQSSVSKSIKVVSALEAKLCPKWINFVMSEDDKEECKVHFYQKFGFPGVIGCVDGTHVAIKPPSPESRHLFYNRKGFYSINAIIICDHKMRIRFIDASHPGATHDALIWKVSSARNYLLEQYAVGRQTNSWLLGDAGYPLEPWIMTPYRTPVSGSPGCKFNTQHSRARNINERAIGVLKNRFRCCLKARQLHYSAEKAAQIINVCAALHNICIHFKVSDTADDYPNEDLTENEFGDFDIENESTYIHEARNTRDRIAGLFS